MNVADRGTSKEQLAYGGGAMWDRPADDEPLEISMYVIAPERPVDQPEVFDDESDGEDVGVGPAADPVLLPRQGTGTWPNGERAVRLGNAEEILITLPTNPFEAMAAARAISGNEGLARSLQIAAGSERVGEFEVGWSGSLRAPVRRRPVSVRLYASPSLNVTVMTIVPAKARKISSRWFVRNGLRAAREFGEQIVAEVEDAPGRTTTHLV